MGCWRLRNFISVTLGSPDRVTVFSEDLEPSRVIIPCLKEKMRRYLTGMRG
jgi:hypothetical protein